MGAAEVKLPSAPEGYSELPAPPEGYDHAEAADTLGAKVKSGLRRAVEDVLPVVTGGLQAVQGAAGLPGDLMSVAGIPKGSRMPTSQEFGDSVADVSKRLGGPNSLPAPTTPEGAFIQSGVRSGVGMMSGNPFVAGVGALSGVLGELGSRLMGKTEQGSLGRVAGEGLGMLPLLLGLKAPAGIRPMQEALNRLGPNPQAVASAIDRGSSLAGSAADTLGMPHTSLWSQLPELNPEIKALRGSSVGGPLNAQAAREGAAAPTGLETLDNLPPTWDPAAYNDPKKALENIIEQGKATSPGARQSSIVDSAQNNNMLGQLVKHLDPFKWPQQLGGAIAGWRGNVGLKGIVEALTSPNADKELKKIAGYDPATKTAAKLLARSLLSMRVGAAPGAEIGPPETGQ